MGSTLSSRAKGTQKTKEPVGARGHTALKAEPKPTATWDLHHTTNDEAIEPSSTFDTESEDDDADEPNDHFNERETIMADCRNLALMAQDFLHPELPVSVTDSTAVARCYFDRVSAPEVESVDEAEARAQILADAAALKKLAIDYMHPELPVAVTDTAATARCYFDRISASEVESLDEAEARAQILADAAALTKLAKDYMHPELPVSVTDFSARARCYFDRVSAPEVESVDEAEARAQIFADVATLKKLAKDYMHPELPVAVTDIYGTARCYFDRISAPEVESLGEAEARAQILADAAVLKKLAKDYMHPELPVSVTDSAATARCYFDRVSAPDVESLDEAEARARVLADVATLKKLAKDYMHPELPVAVTDSAATARCYFDRISAPEVESLDEAEARAQIFADVATLKKLAKDYMHPELPVAVTDIYATARCYFDRISAPEVESHDEAEARAQILADAAVLKKLAKDYMHPELPVSVTDSAATARCYFDRVSAPDVESLDEAEARAQVLADAAALKKLAKDYMHPELPVVVTDIYATARCYFDRPSADLFSPPRRITTVTKIDNEVVRARSDTEQFDFDDDVFHDLKENLTRFSRAHSFGLEEESKVMDKEEEGNLSRSPSCIMLFDMVGERSY